MTILKPGKATAVPGNIRGVPGMVKLVKAGQSSMVVDVEYPAPMVLLVTAELSPTAAAPLALMDWELRSGIAQGQLGTAILESETFSRIVLARSIQVVATNPSPTLDAIVKIVVVPIEATIDVTNILGTDPVAPVGPPNVSEPLFISTAIVNTSFTSSFVPTSPFGVGNYLGMVVRNVSPANRNLYLNLSANPAVIATHQYTQIIAPGGYYEVPFGYNGEINGIWDGADAAGGAVCTFFGFQS